MPLNIKPCHLRAARDYVGRYLSLIHIYPSQRSNGFLTLAGGIVITFSKEILTLITLSLIHI